MEKYNNFISHMINTSKNIAGSIYRSYNPLLNIVKLREIADSIIPNNKSLSLNRFNIIKTLNDFVIENFCGEVNAKQLLVKKYLNDDSVCAFEFKNTTTRTDFIRINGKSYCYEIKSEIDTLAKFPKQAAQNSKIFEHNYIVLSKYHLFKVQNIIPDNYGILLIEKDGIIKLRDSKLNKNLCSESQLKTLTKKERILLFREHDNAIILKNYTNHQINDIFKKALKKRYIQKWRFLTKNEKSILPIDYQFFFNRNIDPKLIYS
jgi:hypothetical protein